jgi:hypothetical protein
VTTPLHVCALFCILRIGKYCNALDECCCLDAWFNTLLAGNLLTDAAIADLAQLLLSSPSAAGVTHLDLSQNQMLTWRCCSALGQLLLAGAQQQQQQQLLLLQGQCSRPATASTRQSIAAGEVEQQQLAGSRPQTAGGKDDQQKAALRPCLSSGSSIASGRPSNAAASQQPAAADLRQVLQPTPQQVQVQQVPLMLQVLSLEGVALGDKGAAALVAALTSNQHLQVCMAFFTLLIFVYSIYAMISLAANCVEYMVCTQRYAWLVVAGGAVAAQ